MSSIPQVNSKCGEIKKFFRKLKVETEFVLPAVGQHPNVFIYNLSCFGKGGMLRVLFYIGWIKLYFFNTDPIYEVCFNFNTSNEWNRIFRKNNRTLLSVYKTKNFEEFKNCVNCALKRRRI
jgi:hypothetical protein